MDEQPVQLIRETRAPVPAMQGRTRRVDYERAGHGSGLHVLRPLGGRQATARQRRTKMDWAREAADLLAGRYAD